jgi:hypothetical protein
VEERVGELGPVARLQVGQEVEPALIEVAVAGATERHDAVGFVAPAERPWH